MVHVGVEVGADAVEVLVGERVGGERVGEGATGEEADAAVAALDGAGDGGAHGQVLRDGGVHVAADGEDADPGFGGVHQVHRDERAVLEAEVLDVVDQGFQAAGVDLLADQLRQQRVTGVGVRQVADEVREFVGGVGARVLGLGVDVEAGGVEPVGVGDDERAHHGLPNLGTGKGSRATWTMRDSV